MSWRDEHQRGSFRGAEFRTQANERIGGRRVVAHEFPSRDDPVTEDLGKRASQFTIECHVVGSDYMARRDALISAIEAFGPGLLVHPTYGRMMAVVFEYSASESTEEGGICFFSITFGEAGQAVPVPATAEIGNASENAADAAEQAAPEELEQSFSIEQAAAFVEENADTIIQGMGEVAKLAASLRGGIGPALRAFEAGLDFLPNNISSLLRAPLSLGQAITGLVLAVSALDGGGRRTRLQSLEMMLDWEPAVEEFPVRTPQRELEAANRTALLRLFRTVAAAELVRTAAAFEYSSYDEAVEARDAIAERLDALALDAADRGDDDAACTFDDLRRALARDIAVRGASLARLYGLELKASEPALVLAHRLYGGASTQRAETTQPLDTRAAAIAARNGVSHPGFLPAGTELELLTPTSEDGALAA